MRTHTSTANSSVMIADSAVRIVKNVVRSFSSSTFHGTISVAELTTTSTVKTCLNQLLVVNSYNRKRNFADSPGLGGT